MRAILFSFAFTFLAAAANAAPPSPPSAPPEKAPKKVWRTTPQVILKDDAAQRLALKDRQDYFNAAKESGYSGVSLEIISATGTFYFESDPLSRSAWSFTSDALAPLSAAWNRLPKSKQAPKIGFILDVSNLARLVAARDLPGSISRPDVNQADDALFGLIDRYRSSDISFICFPPEYMPVALGSFRGARRGLNLNVAPPYLDRYATSPEFDPAALASFVQRFIIPEADLSDPAALGRGGHSIGFTGLMYNWAATLGKETWQDIGFEHPSWRNLVLFRIAQYAPHGIVGAESDFTHLNFSGLRGDIDEFYVYPQNVSAAGRKIANLVLGARKETPEPLISEYIDPILNALEANGYDVRVTFGSLMEGADLYYVVNGKDWLADIPFFESIVDLMDHKSSRFYGTVILHPMGEILTNGPWARVREMFHIPNAEGGWIPNLPEAVQMKMVPLDWGAGRAFEGRGMTRLSSLRASQLGADVILSQVFDGATQGLIFKAGAHYLVNGNFLKLGASYFLSKLIGGAILAPAPVYVTANRKRTCALALEACRLRFKPPVPDPQADWTLHYFSAEGERLRSETIKPLQTLELDMKPFELLILLTEP